MRNDDVREVTGADAFTLGYTDITVAGVPPPSIGCRTQHPSASTEENHHNSNLMASISA